MPLAVVEAMSIGMPVVALGTTALPDVIQDGVNGYISSEPDALIERMKELIADPELARTLGRRARETAQERFGLNRFRRDWDAALHAAIDLAAERIPSSTGIRR
jgi:glycosyltransferase involved in cell wall biosynthesis